MTQSDQKANHVELTRQAAKLVFDAEWARVEDVQHRNVEPLFCHPPTWEVTSAAIDSLSTDKPRGVFYLGECDTGKTSLLWLVNKFYLWRKCYAAAYAVLQPHFDIDAKECARLLTDNHVHWQALRLIRMLTHGDFVSMLRDQERVLFEGGDLLLLDDFGRAYEDKAGFNVSLQYKYFDWRWTLRLPTFVTTNLTSEEMRELGPEWDATVSRLADPKWMLAWSVGEPKKRRRDE